MLLLEATEGSDMHPIIAHLLRYCRALYLAIRQNSFSVRGRLYSAQGVMLVNCAKADYNFVVLKDVGIEKRDLCYDKSERGETIEEYQ